MSYKFLEHTTDALIEVRAKNLDEAFLVAANAVIETTIDQDSVQEKEQKEIHSEGKDLRYLLFSWLEDLIFVLITDGFAIKRIECKISKNKIYEIDAIAFGEPLDFLRHNFKVEMKAPTFHEMKIEQNGGVFMRFLIDL